MLLVDDSCILDRRLIVLPLLVTQKVTRGHMIVSPIFKVLKNYCNVLCYVNKSILLAIMIRKQLLSAKVM